LPHLKFHRIFFLCIDQVRAKLQIDGPFVQKEKTVGEFKNMQAASNTFSLLHNIQQWLFLSRGKTVSPTDGMGLEGWYLHVVTEKNKLAPSQHAVSCIFDMHKGIDKFWSEYVFLSEPTPSEKKIYRDKKLPFPLMIEKASTQKYQLHVTNPEDSSVNYKSGTFFKKEAKEKYKNDEEFRQWFDYAVELSSYYRITHGMFKEDVDLSTSENLEEPVPGIDFDEETGEFFESQQEPVEETPQEEKSEEEYNTVF